ncbi:hypothetical protein GGI20_005963 [Coemansia sp. BCRC 34301]|nr:hypothetical protein GGI20_005963 [Coemansia sp. BCRC 34301]
MHSNNTAATSTLRAQVKPLMRTVMLKIHPDFYANEPIVQQKNQDSVQRLQQLMRPVLEDINATYSRVELSPAFQEKITTTPIKVGYRERGDNNTTSELNTVVFSFSKTHTPNFPKLRAQRTTDFLSLCSLLKIQISPSVLGNIKAAIYDEGVGDSSSYSRKTTLVNSTLAAFQAAREREAKANRERRQASSANMALELMAYLRKQQQHLGKNPTSSSHSVLMLSRGNVYFAPEVPPRLYNRILTHIDSKLPFLEYDLWHSLPVMIVSDLSDAVKGGKPKYPGFVVIPATIHNVQEYSAYLCENLDSIRQARNASHLAHA